MTTADEEMSREKAVLAHELNKDWWTIRDRIREAESQGLDADGLYRRLEATNEKMRRHGVEWEKRS